MEHVYYMLLKHIVRPTCSEPNCDGPTLELLSPPARSIAVSGSLEPIVSEEPELFRFYTEFGVRCGNGHEAILSEGEHVVIEWSDQKPIGLPFVYRLLPF
jgi:hypothetical protein